MKKANVIVGKRSTSQRVGIWLQASISEKKDKDAANQSFYEVALYTVFYCTITSDYFTSLRNWEIRIIQQKPSEYFFKLFQKGGYDISENSYFIVSFNLYVSRHSSSFFLYFSDVAAPNEMPFTYESNVNTIIIESMFFVSQEKALIR